MSVNSLKKQKVCIIYNGAPHYRAGIFKLIDEEFDCDWFIGQGYGGIKQLPLPFFKKAYLQKVSYLIGALCWQKGEVRKLLSREYDIILAFANIPHISTWIGMLLHNIFNRSTKVYFWSHGMLRQRKWPRSLFDKLFFCLPYATFTYGDRARELMISEGLNSDRLFAIHNSLDYDEQLKHRVNLHDAKVYVEHFGNNLPVIIFIGRLVKDKQLCMILDANKILKDKGMPFNVVFIGEGEDMDYLEMKTKELNLGNNVWFYGACYEETQLSLLIYNADLCVSPGPVGLTVMHAMVYGCPVITNDNFGTHGPEFEAIKDGITGCFFKNRDVNELVNKILQWFNDGIDRELIRKNCYEEIDTNWNPYFQIQILKRYLNK